MRRLPTNLRAAALLAVSAEGHYVRVHTTGGDHLLLLRFREALDALGVAEGGQVHRSWRVARDAVTDVQRGDGKENKRRLAERPESSGKPFVHQGFSRMGSGPGPA
ncbi:MAG: LytTR family DNA-binding domain-containing protein [Pseudomonadota bacterium]